MRWSTQTGDGHGCEPGVTNGRVVSGEERLPDGSGKEGEVGVESKVRKRRHETLIGQGERNLRGAP